MPKLSRALVLAIKNNQTPRCLEVDGIDTNELNYKKLAFLLTGALRKSVSLSSFSLSNMTAENAWVFTCALKSPHIYLKSLTLYRFDQTAAQLIVRELPYFSPCIKSLRLVRLEDAACAILYEALCLMTDRFKVRCRGLSEPWMTQFKALNHSESANIALAMPEVRAVPVLSSSLPIRALNSPIMPLLDRLEPFVHRYAALEQQCTEQKSQIDHLQQENTALKNQCASCPPSYSSIYGPLANIALAAASSLPVANPP